jgi:hypothetical protein
LLREKDVNLYQLAVLVGQRLTPSYTMALYLTYMLSYFMAHRLSVDLETCTRERACLNHLKPITLRRCWCFS